MSKVKKRITHIQAKCPKTGRARNWRADSLFWDELPEWLLREIEFELPDWVITKIQNN